MNHPLSRLIARYGNDHGTYLFGEYAAMVTLGFEAFAARHSSAALARLEAQLAPLALWPSSPAPGADGPEVRASEADAVIATLIQPALVWRAGIDLIDEEAAWARTAPASSGAWFEGTRGEIAARWGFAPPPLEVAPEAALPPHAWRLEAAGELLAAGEAYPGQDLVLAPGGAPPPPLPYPWTDDPTGAGRVAWMPIGPGATPPAGCKRLHWLAAVARHVAWSAHRSVPRLLTSDTLAALLNGLNDDDHLSTLARHVSLGQLLRVFRTLLGQGLPLRPLPRMAEALQRAIVADLATRTLSLADVERLERQLPMYATPWLVGIIRKDLGLPAAPAAPIQEGWS
ncbi:MAG: FHIPEP family type III secretion protein [Candidatus Sericytochromatia bacterium]|nr:FHIPEP family type III secretion protein [Candidatus Sericytochromatia bacterium]